MVGALGKPKFEVDTDVCVLDVCEGGLTALNLRPPGRIQYMMYTTDENYYEQVESRFCTAHKFCTARTWSTRYDEDSI